MKRLFAVLLLMLSASAFAQTPIHITLEKGEFTWNFPTAQDGAVNHFELCLAPIACTSISTGFVQAAVTSKTADPLLVGMNLYHASVPIGTAVNVTDVAVARACASVGIGSGCSGVSLASAPFVLDLSTVTNVTPVQKP